MSMYFSRVNAHQRVISAEDFNKVIDGPFYGHYSAFPQALLLMSNGPMNKLPMVARMEFMYGISSMNFHSSRLTQLWWPLNAPTASRTDQHWVTDMVSFLEVISQTVAGWLHRTTTSVMEGAAFCLFWNKHLIRCGFAFPAYNVSAKTIIHGFAEYLLHHHVISHSSVSDQESNVYLFTLQQNKWGNRPMLVEFTSLPMFSTILKQMAWKNGEQPSED